MPFENFWQCCIIFLFFVKKYNAKMSRPRQSRFSQHSFRNRLKSSNLSDIYKNPQIYAGLLQNGTITPWSPYRKISFLAPCFAFNFIASLCALFSVSNVQQLGITARLSGLGNLHIIFGEFLSVVLTIIYQRLVLKLYGSRKKNFCLVLFHFLYTLVGLFLVFMANWQRIQNMSDADSYADSRNKTESGYELSQGVHQGAVMTSRATPPLEKNVTVSSSFSPSLIPIAGYTIMVSSLASGHYLLASIAMSTSEVRDQGKIITLSTLISAPGGFMLCVLGLVNISPDFVAILKTEERHLIKVFHLVCAAIGVLALCTFCCVVAWCSDIIVSSLRGKQLDDEETYPCDRRQTRTAQEIYDECAPLLKSNNPTLPSSISRSGIEPEPEGTFSGYNEDASGAFSQSETIFDDSGLSSSTILPDKRYPYIIVAAVSTNLTFSQKLRMFVRRHKNLAVALVMMFVLSSPWQAFEFSSSIYMTSAEGRHLEKGTQQACLGLLIMYLSFTVFHSLYVKVICLIDWKRLATGLSLMVSIWTMPLAIKYDTALFYVCACAQGLFKVVALGLPKMLTSQAVRSPMGSQKNIVQQILIETPTTALWCMPAVGLAVCSAVFAPFYQAPGLFTVPMQRFRSQQSKQSYKCISTMEEKIIQLFNESNKLRGFIETMKRR
ncbi:hypothetical protein Btru_021954, partial [Bulinus truncatus]